MLNILNVALMIFQEVYTYSQDIVEVFRRKESNTCSYMAQKKKRRYGGGGGGWVGVCVQKKIQKILTTGKFI